MDLTVGAAVLDSTVGAAVVELTVGAASSARVVGARVFRSARGSSERSAQRSSAHRSARRALKLLMSGPEGDMLESLLKVEAHERPGGISRETSSSRTCLTLTVRWPTSPKWEPSSPSGHAWTSSSGAHAEPPPPLRTTMTGEINEVPGLVTLKTNGGRRRSGFLERPTQQRPAVSLPGTCSLARRRELERKKRGCTTHTAAKDGTSVTPYDLVFGRSPRPLQNDPAGATTGP